MNKSIGTMHSNNNNNAQTPNYTDAMYKIMRYSLERESQPGGRSNHRRIVVVPLEGMGAINETGADFRQQEQGTQQQPASGALGDIPPPPPEPPILEMERLKLKNIFNKYRERLWMDGFMGHQQRYSCDGNVSDIGDVRVLKFEPRRHGGSGLGGMERPKRLKPEPEVVFFDTTAEKGTQTKSV